MLRKVGSSDASVPRVRVALSSESFAVAPARVASSNFGYLRQRSVTLATRRANSADVRVNLNRAIIHFATGHNRRRLSGICVPVIK